MARERTFNFIPAHQATPKTIESSKRMVTINTKQKVMFFSIKDPEALIMVGKYLKFYVDTAKNTLAWRVFEKGEMQDLTHLKQVEDYHDKEGKLQLIRVNIKVPLDSLKFEAGKSYPKLELGVYNPQDLLEEKKPYYFVSLNKKEV